MLIKEKFSKTSSVSHEAKVVDVDGYEHVYNSGDNIDHKLLSENFQTFSCRVSPHIYWRSP